jgi:type IV pilus assembly protein PilV
MPTPRASRGYAMLDALFALLLLGAGALVCGQVLLDGMRASRAARMHAEAVLLAADMAELAAMAEAPLIDTADPAPAALDCYGRAAACARGEWLAFEAQAWRERVAAAMPLGRAVVCRDAAPWNAGLRWECHDAPGAPAVVKLGWDAAKPPRVVVQL